MKHELKLCAEFKTWQETIVANEPKEYNKKTNLTSAPSFMRKVFPKTADVYEW
ncbi:13440_t:CDS:2 [Cetraspora pellucida]|uniref:13440_t:CDS:1 n=1 Tax=Cetraspora pellucida TaxID=1433469 RepID=A0A9N8WIE5_9GLOM|nr:13440_t:CDS:2 [Cetraspora pellucida]